MRKITAVLAFLFVLFVASAVFAANFVEIARSDRFLIYADASTLSDKGNYYTIMTKWIPRGAAIREMRKEYGYKIEYEMVMEGISKDGSQIRRMDSFAVSSNGKAFVTPDEGNSWEGVVPQTYGEAVADFVMKSSSN